MMVSPSLLHMPGSPKQSSSCSSSLGAQGWGRSGRWGGPYQDSEQGPNVSTAEPLTLEVVSSHGRQGNLGLRPAWLLWQVSLGNMGCPLRFIIPAPPLCYTSRMEPARLCRCPPCPRLLRVKHQSDTLHAGDYSD